MVIKFNLFNYFINFKIMDFAVNKYFANYFIIHIN